MNIKSRLQGISKPYRAYIFGAVLGILGAMAETRYLNFLSAYGTLLMSAAALLFGGGFVVWCVPFLGVVRNCWIGQKFILLLHVLALIFSTALSRNIVATALGLPPQDFDLSVAAIALLMYPFAWLILILICAGVAAMVLQTAAYMGGLISARFTVGVGHCLGATGLMISASILWLAFASVQEHSLPVVRYIAYFADYHSLPAYLGSNTAGRIRLHENGIVSTSTIEHGTVLITVTRYAP